MIAIIKVSKNLIIILKKYIIILIIFFNCYNLFLFIISLFLLGSTLVIMHSDKEPNSIFGGMAAPSWNSNRKNGEYVKDPEG